jgi:hypothetical protein
MMIRWFVGPTSPHEDEHVIGKGYANYAPYSCLAVLGLVYYFGTTKQLIAVAAALLVFLGWLIEGRVHDLCIRLRRTNLLLTDIHEQRRDAGG